MLANAQKLVFTSRMQPYSADYEFSVEVVPKGGSKGDKKNVLL